VSAHLGGLQAMAGRFDEAATLLERARSIYEELGRTPAILRTLSPIEARAARLRGDLDLAVETYRRSCEALVETHGGFHLATQAAELADLLCDLGRAEEAETWCTIAERYADGDDLEGRISVCLARSRLHAIGGQMGEAEALARRAVDLADQTDALNLRAAVHVALSEILDAGGRTTESLHELEVAAALYHQKENAAAGVRLEERRTAAATRQPAP
jgi:ATP/maltotriose-dependent transcriptional regulator MalT